MKTRAVWGGVAMVGEAKAGRVARRLFTVGARDYGILLALVVELAIFSALRPDIFARFSTFETILASQSALLMVTLALTLTLVVDEFDLSIGAILAFSNILVAALPNLYGWPVPLAIIVALLGGAAVGLVNAFMVVRLGIHSFIATLGMSTLLIGVTLAAAGSTILANVSPALVTFARTEFLELPVSVYYVFLLAAALWYLYEQTPIGRQMYFVGANREVARLSGIRTDAVKAGAFVASAVIAAAAGLVQAGTIGSADPTAGNSFLLPAFAGAFLGATAIRPGHFNAWGALIGGYLLITGITGLALLGLTGWVEFVFNGGALMLAVALSRAVRSRR